MYESISGTGIDLVSISEIEELDKRTRGAFVERTFSDMEKAEADHSPDRYSFLAGRFAVKEAAFKAVAHLTPKKLLISGSLKRSGMPTDLRRSL